GERRAMVHRWRSRQQMAGYLAMVAIGKFRVRDGRSPGGIRNISAVDESLLQDLDRFQTSTGEVTDWAVKTFGRYPFDSTGGIIDNVRVNYALETQNRPVYPGAADVPLIVHEIAHMWFGDSVSVRRWQDIWLNEGFATYAEWLWSEQHNGRTADQIFQRSYRQADAKSWKQRPAEPGGRKTLFSYFPTYTRGAMTVHALRKTVGDRAFFRIVRSWTAQRAHGHATTDDFVAHAERVSKRNLDRLFRDWLFKTGRPPLPKARPAK
ncbi:M1 family aminopeptidase, partial [Actinomadura adrarensis]